uniref:Phospholipase-like protein n=1 Tax=Tanacetum cinerariifolium TaxID=118510 RepID=A0A699H8A8_TANCI|nr:phospholipase-like protein [Tanacetum cinerariifolium]
MGRLLVKEVDDTLMRLIENLEEWNTFPWGEHIWRHLYEQILNVVSNHRWEHLQGINKNHKYVPTYTLSSFVWAFKVLARERNGGVAEKLDFNDDLSNLSADFYDDLNHEFLELFESTICLGGSASLDLRFDEDVAWEYIVQEELRLRIKEKERVQLKEQEMMEEDNKLRLKREKMLRLEEDKRERIAPAKRSQVSGDASLYYWGKTYRMAQKKRPCYRLKEPDMTKLIKDVRPWVEDLLRRYSDTNTVHLTDGFDCFLGKPGGLLSHRVMGELHVVQLPDVLEQARVFKKKGINRQPIVLPFVMRTTFPNRGGGVFGDYGIWVDTQAKRHTLTQAYTRKACMLVTFKCPPGLCNSNLLSTRRTSQESETSRCADMVDA